MQLELPLTLPRSYTALLFTFFLQLAVHHFIQSCSGSLFSLQVAIRGRCTGSSRSDLDSSARVHFFGPVESDTRAGSLRSSSEPFCAQEISNRPSGAEKGDRKECSKFIFDTFHHIFTFVVFFLFFREFWEKEKTGPNMQKLVSTF